MLSLKTALLLALASVKRVGDLQALSVNAACLEFGPNDSKVVLKPRLGYVPKVLSTPFRAFCLVQKVRTGFCWLRAKGGPVTKQRISRWLVDAITLAYSSLGLQCIIGVRAHSTRGIASYWSWSSGVSISIFGIFRYFELDTVRVKY